MAPLPLADFKGLGFTARTGEPHRYGVKVMAQLPLAELKGLQF